MIVFVSLNVSCADEAFCHFIPVVFSYFLSPFAPLLILSLLFWLCADHYLSSKVHEEERITAHNGKSAKRATFFSFHHISTNHDHLVMFFRWSQNDPHHDEET